MHLVVLVAGGLLLQLAEHALEQKSDLFDYCSDGELHYACPQDINRISMNQLRCQFMSCSNIYYIKIRIDRQILNNQIFGGKYVNE